MFHIGARVKAVRSAKALTQDDVAKRLDVTQPTIVMYERAADLKHSIILQLAEALEVHHNYLTGTDAALEPLGHERVVRRESQRVFLATSTDLSPEEPAQFRRIHDHPAAPTTVSGWRELRDMIREFLGSAPDSQPIPTTNGAPTVSPDRTPGKKQMARIDPSALLVGIRRVG